MRKTEMLWIAIVAVLGYVYLSKAGSVVVPRVSPRCEGKCSGHAPGYWADVL